MGLTRPRAHQLQDSDFKASCRAISTSNITLSGGAPATVDGVSLAVQDRILVTGQSTGSENGLYRVTTVGTGSNGTWVRAADADADGDITAGLTVMVTEGTTYADTSWKLTTDDPITVGTTALTFEQASAYGFGTVTVDGTSLVADTVGDTLTVSAGTNISISGDAGTDTMTIALDANPSVTTVTASGNVTAANVNVSDVLRIDQTASGLRMTNVGAFDNDGSDNFRIFATNDLIIAANGESGTAITIDATNQDVAVTNDLTVLGNVTAGNLHADNLTTANAFVVVGSSGHLTQDTTLTVDPGSNYIGINQTSPEVTLHMTGEASQSAQIRMEQMADTSDAPDIRTRKSRGTAAAPTKNNAGDFIYRQNHERYNGTSWTTVGQVAVDTDGTNADRFKMTFAVSEDGASVDAANNQLQIDGNDSGAITFNQAYKFPTADGSAGQVLQTDGSGVLSFVTGAGNVFTTIAVSGQSDIVADSSTDTLTFSAGTGITLTTNAGTDTLTITAETAAFPFAQDGDFESVTDDPASESEDLGDLASTNATTYDLGTIISAEGLIYPGQLVLPQYTTVNLPNPEVEGQLAYDTDENAVKFTDGTQWTGYAGLASPTFTGTTTVANITVTGTTTVANITQTDTSSIQSQSEGNYATKRYVLHGTTTDATETEIFVGGTANSRISISSNTTVTADAVFTARRTDATGHSAGFHLYAVADNFSGTSADVGNVYEVTIADDTGNLAVDLQADDTTDSLKVLVQGEASKTISWMCVLNTVEVSQ